MRPQTTKGTAPDFPAAATRTTRCLRTETRTSNVIKLSRSLRGWNLIVKNHRDWLEVEPNRALLHKLLDLILEHGLR